MRKYGTPWEWVKATFIIVGSLAVAALLLLFVVLPMIVYVGSIFVPR